MTHEIKIWPCFYERVADGTKTFEVRDNDDRGFQNGDTVVLKEWSNEMVEVEPPPPGCISAKAIIGFTGRELKFKIGYVLPLSKDRCVFSLLKE